MHSNIHADQPGRADVPARAIVGDRVELQLLTTLRCNLRCTYCSLGVGDVLGSQRNVEYSLDALDRFIATHFAGHEIYVTFYGGEPTLNRPFIAEVMRRYPTLRFQLQTNGTLLQSLPDEILARLSNVLVSIDGGEAITDGYRGRGIYRKVVRNVEAIRARIGGTLTARVTWSSADTTFDELDELIASFDFLYFQFVAQEGAYSPHAMARKRQVLARLVDRFFAGDALYPVVPIMGTVRNKLDPDGATSRYAGHTQCRASTHILNVLPDGKIFPCPDLMYMPRMQQGDIVANWLRPSPLQPHENMPCTACSAFPYCRRNCMKNLHLAYVEGDARYRDAVVEPICELVRFLGAEIDRHDPAAWAARLGNDDRETLMRGEIYDYVEVMP